MRYSLCRPKYLPTCMWYQLTKAEPPAPPPPMARSDLGELDLDVLGLVASPQGKARIVYIQVALGEQTVVSGEHTAQTRPTDFRRRRHRGAPWPRYQNMRNYGTGLGTTEEPHSTKCTRPQKNWLRTPQPIVTGTYSTTKSIAVATAGQPDGNVATVSRRDTSLVKQ